MRYVYTLPESTSFTGTGLEGYTFGPLHQDDLDVYYIISEKGHDTFMVSKRITRTYYVLDGRGYFTIENRRHNVSPGVLVEIPPKVEFSYSGKMTLIAFARPRWFNGNDRHTRWNSDVTSRPYSFLHSRESVLTRLIRLRIAGKSPTGALLRFSRLLWSHLPPDATRLNLVRSYGKFVHRLARIHGYRAQAFSTHFLRNRPALDLIGRLLAKKSNGERVRVAVLGCSLGAEAYSIAWTIRSARPDLKLVMTAVDISPHAVNFAKEGNYPLASSDPLMSVLFERMSATEKEELFYTDGQTATVKPWIKEGMQWRVGDVGEREVIDALEPQDIVVASNFLCHMSPMEAERCLRNIVRSLSPYGYLFVSGIDLKVRTKVAMDLGWKPVQELLEEIHEGDPCMRSRWPWHYGGLEPLDKRRPDWKIRYAAVFQAIPLIKQPALQPQDELDPVHGG